MLRDALLITVVLALGACGGGAEGGATKAAEGDAKAGGSAAAKDLADAGPRGDPKKGEEVFNTKCMSCHQKDGTGMGGTLGADFINNKAHLAKPDSELLKSIAEGVQGAKAVMPPQKDLLSEQERKDALAYIRATFGDK